MNESKLGIEYLCDVISSCEQNGVSCIVDDANGDFLIYDVKKGLWIDKNKLSNADESIFDLFQDDDLYEQVMFKASGDEFKEFAVKWNDLQKKGESDEVYKSRECKPIMGAFAESLGSDEDEVTIQWVIDDSDLGIISGSEETFVFDARDIYSYDDFKFEVARAVSKNYRGMWFDVDDEFVIVDSGKWMRKYGNREDGMIGSEGFDCD